MLSGAVVPKQAACLICLLPTCTSQRDIIVCEAQYSQECFFVANAIIKFLFHLSYVVTLFALPILHLQQIEEAKKSKMTSLIVLSYLYFFTMCLCSNIFPKFLKPPKLSLFLSLEVKNYSTIIALILSSRAFLKYLKN